MHALVDVLMEHYWPLAAERSTYRGSDCFGSGRGRPESKEKGGEAGATGRLRK